MTEVVKRLLIANPDPHNFNNLCRLCGRYNWNMTNIFDITNRYDYGKVINLHFHDFHITENDDLPLKLCIQCVATLTGWHEFYNSCIDVNRRLNLMKLQSTAPVTIEVDIADDSDDEVSILPDHQYTPNDNNANTLEVKNLNDKHGEGDGSAGDSMLSIARENSRLPLEVDLSIDEENGEEFKNFDDCFNDSTEFKHTEGENYEQGDVSFTDDIEVIEIKMNDEDSELKTEDDSFDDDSCVEDEFDDIENVHIQEEPPSPIPSESIQTSSTKDKLDSEEMAILQHDLNTVVNETTEDNDFFKRVENAKSNSKSNESGKGQEPVANVAQKTPASIPVVKKSTVAARNRLRICHLCGKNYYTDSGFRHHMVMHRDPNFFCHLCGRYFHESQNLKKHISTIHSDERPFQCHMCGMNYKRRDVLQEHIKRVHDGIKKPWNAETMKKYRRSSKLQPKKRYQCPHCYKCLASKAYLKDHINGVHIKEKIYQCNECDMAFTRKQSFTYHFKRAHIEKKQVLEPRGTFLKDCEYCGLQFRVKKYYDIHVTSKHFNKYPCEHCELVFENKFHLTQHRETVHADQLSKCDQCGKNFPEEVHLKRHIYLCHTKRIPYECHHCGHKANKKSTLTVHMRKHTGEKPYHCDICQRDFSQSVDFRKHRANHFKSKAEERRNEIKDVGLRYFIQTLDVTADMQDERSDIPIETVTTIEPTE